MGMDRKWRNVLLFDGFQVDVASFFIFPRFVSQVRLKWRKALLGIKHVAG